MEQIIEELNNKGYCIIPGILSDSEIKYSLDEFNKWKEKIPDHDKMHQTIDPHGIYKYHRVGHTKHAWFIRTRPKIQEVFKNIWKTDELVVSFDGCCYIPKNNKQKDKIWTHTDQSCKSSERVCIQGFVALTSNKERTFRVYEGSHKLHKEYFQNQIKPLKEKISELKELLKKEDIPNKEEIESELIRYKKEILKFNNNWQLINHDELQKLEEYKRILDVSAGSLVLWDSRCYHQNQFGKPNSEERIVQYVCFLPKNNPLNTKSMQKKRLKYLEEQRTTSHWPYPIKVNGLQPRTYGDKSKLINYESLEMNDLSEFQEDIIKII